MGISDLGDILPKSLATSFVAWGAISYFFAGPEVAARVAQVDHLPVCQANYTQLVHKAAEAEKRDIPAPDAQADMGLSSAEVFLNSPFMRELSNVTGMGDMMNGPLRQARAQQRAAREAYERRVAEIEASTRRKLANSDGFCGCVADAAIDKSRSDWALFAGSLGLFSSSKVENFREAMTNHENVSACMGTGQAKENA